MLRDELVSKWERRRAEFLELAATVQGAAMCALFVADLEALASTDHEEWVSIPDAAASSGYSQQHIRRLIQSGQLLANGLGKARRVRLDALPRKPVKLAAKNGELHLIGATAEQAVRESVGAS